MLLVHPGGPFWANKDVGAWSIPKGEYVDGETPIQVAMREFNEETGFTATGPFIPLGDVKQPSGKIVSAWAFEGDCDPSLISSNTCLVEWPPKSGKRLEIPEVDRGDWFPIEAAHDKLSKAQSKFLDRLADTLKEQS